MKCRVTYRRGPLVLDFDLENRPLAYLGPDFTTGEITAIAWSWEDEDAVEVRLLGRDDPRAMLRDFLDRYNGADMVTGHYILGHDLPVLNGALLEYGLPLLGPKYVSDTKVHLKKRKYLSASQESLAGMLGLGQEKDHLSNPMWREANRLTPAGLEFTRSRVVHDVIQHKALRQRLLAAGALKPPTLWCP